MLFYSEMRKGFAFFYGEENTVNMEVHFMEIFLKLDHPHRFHALFRDNSHFDPCT